jgi:hypothetical protein
MVTRFDSDVSNGPPPAAHLFAVRPKSRLTTCSSVEEEKVPSS